MWLSGEAADGGRLGADRRAWGGVRGEDGALDGGPFTAGDLEGSTPGAGPSRERLAATRRVSFDAWIALEDRGVWESLLQRDFCLILGLGSAWPPRAANGAGKKGIAARTVVSALIRLRGGLTTLRGHVSDGGKNSNGEVDPMFVATTWNCMLARLGAGSSRRKGVWSRVARRLGHAMVRVGGSKTCLLRREFDRHVSCQTDGLLHLALMELVIVLISKPSALVPTIIAYFGLFIELILLRWPCLCGGLVATAGACIQPSPWLTYWTAAQAQMRGSLAKHSVRDWFQEAWRRCLRGGGRL